MTYLKSGHFIEGGSVTTLYAALLRCMGTFYFVHPLANHPI